MTYKIRVSPRGWACTPRGGATISFSAGVYVVPDDMSDELAQRCLRSGRGTIVNDDVKRGAPNNRKRALPENKSAS